MFWILFADCEPVIQSLCTVTSVSTLLGAFIIIIIIVKTICNVHKVTG